MIIDSHCHAGAGDGLTGPWDTRAPLDNYLRWCREAGIGHSVLFPAFHTDYAVANAEVAGIVGRDRRRFSGYVFVHCQRDAGRVRRMVTHFVRGHRFCGIKCHRHDARLTREVCETARGLRLPVLYDVMGEVSSVRLFAGEYPDVAFVVPHLGSFGDDWKAQQAFLDPLAQLPNVYTDTSGVRRFDLLQEAVGRAGAGKVLFGSDGPWLHPGVELAKVAALKLPPPQARLVLAGNWLRLTRPARSLAPRRDPQLAGRPDLQRPVGDAEPPGRLL